MIYDRLRGTTARLFVTFGVEATVSYQSAPASVDRITGKRIAGTVATKTVRAIMGRKRVTSDDGTTRIETIAKLDGSAVAGDHLTLGKTYTITSVEEVAPDGGSPFLWIVGLK